MAKRAAFLELHGGEAAEAALFTDGDAGPHMSTLSAADDSASRAAVEDDDSRA